MIVKYSILNRGIGIESEKYYYGNKLARDQKLGNKSENGNKLKIELKVYYSLEQNSRVFGILNLTASVL